MYIYIYIYAYMCVEKLKHIFTETFDHLLVKALSALAARPSAFAASQGPRPWLTGYLPRRAMTSWQISCVVGSLEGTHTLILGFPELA